MAYENYFHVDKKVPNSQTKKDQKPVIKRSKFRDLIDQNSPAAAMPDSYEMKKADTKTAKKAEDKVIVEEKKAKRPLSESTLGRFIRQGKR